MMNKLPCAVVRDLLPSYIEGLTEPESTCLVKEHLTQCADCTAHYRAMQPDICQEQQEQAGQVNYLRKVQRKGHQRVMTAVLCTAAVLLLVLGGKLFVWGSRINAQDFDSISYTAQLDADTPDQLKLEIMHTSSAISFSDFTTHTQNGEIHLDGRKVLASPINRNGHSVQVLDLTGIHKVYAFGKLIWQNGVVIPQQTHCMYNARTPYVGAISKVSQAASTLPLPLRNMSWELLTDAEPFGVVLHFTEPLPLSDQHLMQRDAALLLALVDNLSEVYWTYPDLDGGQRQEVLRIQDFNAKLAELTQQYNDSHHTQWAALSSVKDYSESIYTFQQLRALVDQHCDSPLIQLQSVCSIANREA